MKNIALVVDVENWAFYNIAKNLKNNLSKYYNIDIIPLENLENNVGKFWLVSLKYDLIHFFWREQADWHNREPFRNYIISLKGNTKKFIEKYINNRTITTSVYDHLFLGENDIKFTDHITSFVKGYTVSSEILFDIYNKLPIKTKPKMVITDGVDLNRFKPINIERFSDIKNRKIVIGWTGNSNWIGSELDFKGVNTILKPAIKQLQDEGYNLEMYFADRQERMIPHDEMVNYYSKIDLYICTSLIEGTPNPVLESMACGVPIISTRVGIVPEVLGENGQKFILEERNVDCLKEKIKLLINDSDKFRELSNENLNRIKDWTWEKKSQQFKQFFDSFLN